MAFTIKEAEPADLDGLAAIMVQAMTADVLWYNVKGSITPADELEVAKATLRARLLTGVKLGSSKVWKAVDENK